MPRRDFVSLLNVPDTGNPELNKFLNAMKENVELLAGLRGASHNYAVVKGDITTDYPDQITAVSVASVDGLRDSLRQLMVEMKT